MRDQEFELPLVVGSEDECGIDIAKLRVQTIATPRHASALEAARCQPQSDQAPAHDAFTRVLQRLEPDPETLWQEVQSEVRRDDGFLILDDSR